MTSTFRQPATPSTWGLYSFNEEYTVIYYDAYHNASVPAVGLRRHALLFISRRYDRAILIPCNIALMQEGSTIRNGRIEASSEQ